MLGKSHHLSRRDPNVVQTYQPASGPVVISRLQPAYLLEEQDDHDKELSLGAGVNLERYLRVVLLPSTLVAFFVSKFVIIVLQALNYLIGQPDILKR